MASDLITLAEYLQATNGGTPDADAQSQLEWAITSASQIIRNYLDRDVVLASEDTTPATRTFRYTGGGVLEIDDATTITSVATTVTPWNPSSRTLLPQEWIGAASTANLPVIDYIQFAYNWPNLGWSPAMGFKENEDVYASRYGARLGFPSFDVTAVWGWPNIPRDIQQACIWQTTDVIAPETPYITESIEGYSHSFRETRASTGQNVAPITAVTPRAQSLLDPYVRVNV